MKWTLLVVFFLSQLSSCTYEAQVLSRHSSTGDNGPSQPDTKTQATQADFVAGEVVTTGNGAVIKGTFGEISEKKELANGASIEGAFYE